MVIVILMTLSIVSFGILRLVLIHSKRRLNHARLMEIEQQMSRNRASLRQHNEYQGNYTMEYVYACNVHTPWRTSSFEQKNVVIEFIPTMFCMWKPSLYLMRFCRKYV